MKAKATILLDEKSRYDDGAIREMIIWRLPVSNGERAHGLKYSLYYGYRGARVVGYDNERGKGDHRHLRGAETPYRFVSIERLIADFFADIAEVRNE